MQQDVNVPPFFVSQSQGFLLRKLLVEQWVEPKGMHFTRWAIVATSWNTNRPFWLFLTDGCLTMYEIFSAIINMTRKVLCLGRRNGALHHPSVIILKVTHRALLIQRYLTRHWWVEIFLPEWLCQVWADSAACLCWYCYWPNIATMPVSFLLWNGWRDSLVYRHTYFKYSACCFVAGGTTNNVICLQQSTKIYI